MSTGFFKNGEKYFVKGTSKSGKPFAEVGIYSSMLENFVLNNSEIVEKDLVEKAIGFDDVFDIIEESKAKSRKLSDTKSAYKKLSLKNKFLKEEAKKYKATSVLAYSKEERREMVTKLLRKGCGAHYLAKVFSNVEEEAIDRIFITEILPKITKRLEGAEVEKSKPGLG